MAWIDENGELRRRHGILFELVVERSARQHPAKAQRPDDDAADPDELIVLTAWPDHDTFDAWINTPDRDGLTTSPTHQAVEFRPLTRYDVMDGYVAETLTATRLSGGQP